MDQMVHLHYQLSVLVNGGPSSFFKASRGLRQGDPLSHLLFIIAMEALNRLHEQARVCNMIKGIPTGDNRSHLEISYLFFANDTLIFCQPETSMLLDLRCVLLCFQAIIGLKINMNKSELVRICDGTNGILLPIKYLDLPLGAKHNNERSWEPVIKLFENRLAGWKRRYLLKGGRPMLLKALSQIFPSVLCLCSPSLLVLSRNQNSFNADFCGAILRITEDTIWSNRRM